MTLWVNTDSYVRCIGLLIVQESPNAVFLTNFNVQTHLSPAWFLSAINITFENTLLSREFWLKIFQFFFGIGILMDRKCQRCLRFGLISIFELTFLQNNWIYFFFPGFNNFFFWNWFGVCTINLLCAWLTENIAVRLRLLLHFLATLAYQGFNTTNLTNLDALKKFCTNKRRSIDTVVQKLLDGRFREKSLSLLRTFYHFSFFFAFSAFQCFHTRNKLSLLFSNFVSPMKIVRLRLWRKKCSM